MTAPTLLALTLTDTVDVNSSSTLEIKAEAKDSDGIAFLHINWVKPLSYRTSYGYQDYLSYSPMSPKPQWTSGSNTDQFQIQKINEPGQYVIQAVMIGDVHNNISTYTTAQLTALGFDTSFMLTGSTPDRGLPTLTSLAMPTTIDTSKGPVRWGISAGATDAMSDVQTVSVSFDNPFKGAFTARPSLPALHEYFEHYSVWVGAAANEFTAGTATGYVWVAARNGIYNLGAADVTDKAGNVRHYEAAELHKLGMPTHITVSDGTYVAPKLTATVTTAPATAAQDGAIVLKVASDAFKTGENTVELTVRYNASAAHFDTWSAGSTATSAVVVKHLELGNYGEATVTGTIQAVKDGFIELRFKPVATKGTFGYDVTDITLNGQVLANSFNQSLTYRIPVVRDGSTGADNLVGDGRDESIQGGAGNDVMSGAGGMDDLLGGAGTDTALYAKARGLYKVERSGAELVVSNLAEASDVDRLNSVEILKFADLTMAFDPTGDAAQVYRLYKAAFDRAPDAAGFGFWVHAREAGVSLHDIANGFVASAEFKTKYGASATNASIVKGFYENVLDRKPDAAGTAFWEGVLERKAADVGNVLIGFADSSENQTGVAGLIGQGMSYIPYG